MDVLFCIRSYRTFCISNIRVFVTSNFHLLIQTAMRVSCALHNIFDQVEKTYRKFQKLELSEC